MDVCQGERTLGNCKTVGRTSRQNIGLLIPLHNSDMWAETHGQVVVAPSQERSSVSIMLYLRYNLYIACMLYLAYNTGSHIRELQKSLIVPLNQLSSLYFILPKHQCAWTSTGQTLGGGHVTCLGSRDPPRHRALFLLQLEEMLHRYHHRALFLLQ